MLMVLIRMQSDKYSLLKSTVSVFIFFVLPVAPPDDDVRTPES